jgi:hypothetical protein
MSITNGKTPDKFVTDLIAEKGPDLAVHYCLGWIASMEKSMLALRQQVEILTITLNDIKRTTEEARRRGGQSTSEAKAKAARANGMKGGRPRKDAVAD